MFQRHLAIKPLLFFLGESTCTHEVEKSGESKEMNLQTISDYKKFLCFLILFFKIFKHILDEEQNNISIETLGNNSLSLIIAYHAMM